MKLFGAYLPIFLAIGLAIVLLECEAGRRGGGGRRGSSSSSGGWFGSRRKSNSGSSGSSWFGKKKTNTNSQSSYPKQQYTNTGGQSRPGQQPGGSSIGGGGWANTGNKPGTNIGSNNKGYGTNTNIGGGGWNNRNSGSGSRNSYYNNRGNMYSGSNYNSYSSGYGRQNYGYHGGGLFNNHYSSGGLFGGGRNSFALGAGAGFLGGAMAGVAAMSMYHRYRMYSTMMMYQGGGYGYGGMHGGYGYGHSPYGMGGGRRGMLLQDEFDCIGGCPMNAFCDYGICRCRTGYDARYGQCWNRMEDFDRNKDQWQQRQGSGYNPYQSCSDHKDCKNVDMNMICGQSGTSSVGSRSCQCRDDMKWNDEGLECQIYIDVNCTDIKTVESPDNTVTLDTPLESPNKTLGSDKLEEEFEFDEKEFSNLTDSNGNLNISEISADETLSSSELSKLNPNETSPDEIRGAFCRDVARVSRSYEQTLVPPRQNDNYNNYGRRGGSFGIVGLVIIIIIACCACGLVWKFLEKIKEACCGNSRNKRQDYDMASRSSSDHQPDPQPVYNHQPDPQPVYNHQGQKIGEQAYPPTQPDNTLYPQIQPDLGMPPLGPAIPPTQPGYPNNPTPYPPATGAGPVGGLPYPVAGPTGGAPPPYPAGESFPPYPPAAGAAPPYPPGPGAAPFYPPVAGAAPPYPPVPGAVPSYPPVPGAVPSYPPVAGAAPPYPPASNAPPYPTQPAYNPTA